MDGNWLKQAADKPLYPDLLWSRPENRNLAGKLLIIGGNPHSFKAPATAYGYAGKAGIGTAHVLLPDSLQKTVSQLVADAYFAPSNPSGGFAKAALAEFIDLANWADLTLIAGDLGGNSETDILLESFVSKYKGLLCLTRDALNSFMADPTVLFNRRGTIPVLGLSELQKLGSKLSPPRKFLSSMNLLNFIEELNNLSGEYSSCLVVHYQDQIIVSYAGQASSTPAAGHDLLLTIASFGSVWWLQNSSTVFEAWTTAAYELIHKR